MSRELDTVTLDQAARDYAGAFLLPTVMSRSNPDVPAGGRGWVMRNFNNATFEDCFDYLLAEFRQNLGPRALSEFDDLAAKTFKPRDPAVLEKLLAEKLAITLEGKHIDGKVGTTKVHGNRYLGVHLVDVETLWSVRRRKALIKQGRDPGPRETEQLLVNHYWPIYAGETEERIAGNIKDVAGADGPGVDPLPEGTPGMPVGALNTRIAAVIAIDACDAVVDRLDTGSGTAVAEGRSGAQPADPDAAVIGTLLFTLTYSATAFGAAADTTGEATASAAAISDDTSADATGTLGYVRCSSTNDGSTPLVDLIDGEAGTGTADWVFNTVAIVAGAVVSASSHDVLMPQL